MEWFMPKRRGPEWKHGWTGQTLNNISTPPLPLLAFFGIVILFLSLSTYTGYKVQTYEITKNIQLFLILLPILFIVLIATSSQPDYGTEKAGGFPWGVAVLLVVLLVLVSYQSTFQSKWFGALRSAV